MKKRVVDRLGPPSLELARFRLWVHGRTFPDAHDCWDGNWLRVTAHCAEAGGRVLVTGSILDAVSFLGFHAGLVALHRDLAGEAVLSSHEPNLVVRLQSVDAAGHLLMRVEITPDLVFQQHWFEFQLDQSCLPPVIAQCAEILKRYPPRGA